MNKHITKEISGTVLWVNKLFKGRVTFCGSFGLTVNGKLDRPIHDVDCITDDDYYGVKAYGLLSELDIRSSNSEKFYVDGILVKVFKVESPFGINVDVMFRPDGIISKPVKLKQAVIKVEVPESAIKIKKGYLKLVGRTPNPASVKKHSSDLDFILGL